MCGFFLSILWRASISSRPECRLTLGPYEDEARDVLFDLKPLSGFYAFQVMVQRYRSKAIDVDKLYMLPEFAPFGDLNAYGLSLLGYRITRKIDSKPLPNYCRPHIINGKRALRGLVVDFEGTQEFSRAIEMIIRTENRKSGKSRTGAPCP